MPTLVFQRCCDNFLLPFVGNMMKQRLLFSHLSLDSVQIKTNKQTKPPHYLHSQYYSWPEILQEGFSYRKEFNLAVCEGHGSVEVLVQSLQSEVIVCFCSALSTKSCITVRTNQVFLQNAVWCHRNVPAQSGSRSDVATTGLISW